jgi:hypothetical protein
MNVSYDRSAHKRSLTLRTVSGTIVGRGVYNEQSEMLVKSLLRNKNGRSAVELVVI